MDIRRKTNLTRRVLYGTGLLWLLGSTQGLGSCNTSCSSCEGGLLPPPPVDAVWCDVSATPCALVGPDGTTCVAPLCANLDTACNVQFNGTTNVTTCDPQTTTCVVQSATMPGGTRVCFDHTQVSPDQACQNACTNFSNPSKFNLPFNQWPLSLVFPSNCSGHADLSSNHAQYNAKSAGSSVNNYLANGCLHDGPAISMLPTNAVTLSGGGTVQSAGNGVPPHPVNIKGGHFHLAAPNTSCSALQTNCPVGITEVEIDFEDINGDTGNVGGGGTHSMTGGGLFLDEPVLTPSGTFFPAGGGLPASFTFPMPPGIVFDAVGVGDGQLIGTTAASDQELNATINLATGTLVFDYDIMETVNGSVAELSGTGTTNQVLELAPVLTTTSSVSVDATQGCSANVTLTANASSPLGFPVTLDYAVDSPASAINAGPSASFSLPVGAHSATIIARDANGGQTQVPVSISVNDKSPPVITAPPDVTITTCVNASIGTATATDCSGNLTITNDAPAQFPIGTTVVTWTATDPAGNKATAQQRVTAILGDDPSCCPAGTNVILGTDGADVLTGTAGNDCILGLGGDDTIDASYGDDYVSGGAGNDTIMAGPGNDFVWGGPGVDTIDGSSDNDYIDGTAGDVNVCSGGTGINKIVNCQVASFCTAACCSTNSCTP